jgi:DNA-directed RNA polymerase subunit RPC12/RpoP
MEYTCIYCGKKVSHESEYNAKKKLNIHLKYCPVRRAGIDFKVGERTFNVKPRSMKCIHDLNQTLKDLSTLPYSVQEAAFMGLLLGEKRNGRIKDFSY